MGTGEPSKVDITVNTTLSPTVMNLNNQPYYENSASLDISKFKVYEDTTSKSHRSRSESTKAYRNREQDSTYEWIGINKISAVKPILNLNTSNKNFAVDKSLK